MCAKMNSRVVVSLVMSLCFLFYMPPLNGLFLIQISSKKKCFGTVYGWPFKLLLWFRGISQNVEFHTHTNIHTYTNTCAHMRVHTCTHAHTRCKFMLNLLAFLVLFIFYFLSEYWRSKKCIPSYCPSTSSSFKQYISGNSGSYHAFFYVLIID